MNIVLEWSKCWFQTAYLENYLKKKFVAFGDCVAYYRKDIAGADYIRTFFNDAVTAQVSFFVSTFFSKFLFLHIPEHFVFML